MAGRKRAAPPSGHASADLEAREKKLLLLTSLMPPAFQRVGVFPFLRLPAEIRNMVYHYVFYGTDHIDMTREKSYPWYANWGEDVARRRERLRNRPDLSLLYVSRQLNHETALLPYKLTRFRFAAYTTLGQHPRVIRKFLEQRSTAQIEVLSDMRFYCLSRNYEDRVEKSGDGAYWMRALALAWPPS